MIVPFSEQIIGSSSLSTHLRPQYNLGSQSWKAEGNQAFAILGQEGENRDKNRWSIVTCVTHLI